MPMSLPVDKALRKAQSHIKVGELAEAEELYKQVLLKYPKNKKAIQGYQKLKAGITSKNALTIEPPQELIDEAISLYNQGQFKELLSKVDPLLSLFPKATALFNLQGACNAALQNHDSAIDSYKQAIRIQPDCAEAYCNMGASQNDKGDLDAAIGSYKRAIKIKPHYADAHSNMGNTLKENGDFDAAIDNYRQAIKINPSYAEAYCNMGNALQQKGQLNAAIDSYKQATKIKPDYAKAYYNMGAALQEQNEITASINNYKKAIKIKPDYAEAFNNMGTSLQQIDELDLAIKSYEQAIKIKPDFAEAFNNMGSALTDRGDLGASIESCKKALEINPSYFEAYSNMGVAWQQKGDLDTAIESHKQAINIKPDYAQAHLNLSFALLNNGMIKEGLEEFEWRWKAKSFNSRKRNFSKPIWNGTESLRDKKILIWGEQGISDVIIWSSCLTHLASQAKHCTLECQEKIVSLIARSFPDIDVRVNNAEKDAVRDDFDLHLPLGSLFRYFIPEVSSNTKAVLVPDPVRVKYWKQRLKSLGQGPFVGISWKSPLITQSRSPNYTQISDWEPVFSLGKVTFINLQSTNFKDDLIEIYDRFGITVHNFDDLDHYNNIDDVAALSAALDVVVSVFTAVAAISAEVGTPTKFINWRQSPWSNLLYTPPGPSVRLFERDTWETWDEVFQAIARNLKEY